MGVATQLLVDGVLARTFTLLSQEGYGTASCAAATVQLLQEINSNAFMQMHITWGINKRN